MRRDGTYKVFYLWQSMEEGAVIKEGKKYIYIYSKFSKFLKAKCELAKFSIPDNLDRRRVCIH